MTIAPARRGQAYREAGWWTDDLLDQFVLRHATTCPDAVALRSGTRVVTYAELAGLVQRLSANLLALGLRADDRVVVQLPNQLELVALVLALVGLGAPPVLAVPALGQREIRHVVEATGAVALAVEARSRHSGAYLGARDLCVQCPTLRHLLVTGRPSRGALDMEVDLEGLQRDQGAGTEAGERRIGADSVALYLLSGGTTGLPKPIPRTHNDYVYNVKVSSELAALDERSVYLPALPATHNFGLGCPGVFGALSVGGSVVLRRNADVDAMLDALAEEDVTVAAAVPSTAMQWVEAIRAGRVNGWRPSRLQVLQVGGARLQPSHARAALDTLGCQVQQVFGMAEGLLNFTRLDDPEEVVVGTQGRPASPGDEWRIVDAHGDDVATGQPGELLVRGPYTIGGYLADAETNGAAFTSDGYYRTGDVVRWHATGNFVVDGRRRDFINRGGEKISAEELEALLAAHGDVIVSAAVAMPSRAFGEEVCLFAVVRPGAQVHLRGIRDFLRTTGMARFKLPTRLEVVEQLPLTAVGKIDRVALRFRAAEAGST